MAFGMKHWIGLVAAGLALVALLLLPPSVKEREPNLTPTHEELRAGALRTEFRQGWDVLKRMRWADSLAALAVETAEDGVAVAFPGNPLSDEEMAMVRQRLRGELAAAGGLRDGVVVGLVAQEVNFAAGPEAPPDTRGSEEIYMGRLDGVEYCLRVDGMPTDEITGEKLRNEWLRGMPESWGDFSDNLGLCRVAAAHGLPGEKITAWLENGAAGFARSPAHHPVRREMGEYWMRQGNLPFGFQSGLRGSRSQALALEQCHSGMAEACGEVVAAPEFRWPATVDAIEVVRRSPAVALGPYNGLPFGNAGGYLLGDLEEDFGPEAFGRFWRSDADVRTAFQDAFGVSLDEWALGWVQETFGLNARGPGLSKTAGLGGLLTISLFALIAGAWTRRRKVA